MKTTIPDEKIDKAIALHHGVLKERAEEIYRTVMRFLEGKHQSNTGPLQDLLEIPVVIKEAPSPDGPMQTMHLLRFRKVVTMGPSTSYAQSVEREDLKIRYDPNWEVRDKLVELLNQ